MKIVFLDIDGVLNHAGTPMFDDKCMQELKRILVETGASVVLSSSWKEVFTRPDETHNQHLLSPLLNDPSFSFLGFTPDVDEENREKEVEAWLKQTSEKVESFVILDDLDFDFPDYFPNNFIKTAGYFGKGLTSAHADRAIQILNHTRL